MPLRGVNFARRLGVNIECRLTVKHLLLARIERRPVHLDLARYPHLPRPFVAATRSADYASLLAGGADHG